MNNCCSRQLPNLFERGGQYRVAHNRWKIIGGHILYPQYISRRHICILIENRRFESSTFIELMFETSMLPNFCTSISISFNRPPFFIRGSIRLMYSPSTVGQKSVLESAVESTFIHQPNSFIIRMIDIVQTSQCNSIQQSNSRKFLKPEV